MVADLEEIIGYLLVNINSILKVFTKLQRLCLVVYSFFVVLEILQIGGNQLQSFELSLNINFTRGELLKDDRELLIRLNVLLRELVSLSDEQEGLLNVLILAPAVINLQLDIKGQLGRLNALLEVLKNEVVLCKLLV